MGMQTTNSKDTTCTTNSTTSSNCAVPSPEVPFSSRRLSRIRKSMHTTDRSCYWFSRMLSRRPSSINTAAHHNYADVQPVLKESVDNSTNGKNFSRRNTTDAQGAGGIDASEIDDTPDSLTWACFDEEVSVLGQGAFGRVSLVRHKTTGQKMVLKECLDNTPENYEIMLREFSLLHSLRHENVLQFISVLLKHGRLCILLEYVEGGTLFQRLYEDPNLILPWGKRITFARDIAAGMKYLHDSQIVHRDLNSHNILIRKDESAVVADFGLSKLVALRKSDLENIRMKESPSMSKKRNSHACCHHLEQPRVKEDTQQEASDPLHPVHWISARRRAKSRDTRIEPLTHRPPPMMRLPSRQEEQSETDGLPQECAKNECCKASVEGNDDLDGTESEPEVDLRRRYSIVGNPWWMAPEMLAHQPYDHMVDVYSYGTVLCELWIRRADMLAEDLPRRSTDMALDWHQVSALIPKSCPPLLKDITAKCCHANPSMRPTFHRICQQLIRASLTFDSLYDESNQNTP